MLGKPSPHQIRAARALLNWSRADLAERTDVSELTIHRLENDTGDTAPREATIKNIIRALHVEGIEFTENDGVRRRTEGVQIFKGMSGFEQFCEIVYDHLSQHGGMICVSGVDESLFAKYQRDQEGFLTKVTKLATMRGDIKALALIREGDQNFAAKGYAEYRWQDKKDFSPTAFYVFGDNLALISFNSENPPHVILITSAVFAQAYRHSFNVAWKNAKIPSALRNKTAF